MRNILWIILLLVFIQGCVQEERVKKTSDKEGFNDGFSYPIPPLLQFELPSHKLTYSLLASWETTGKTILYLLRQGDYYASLEEPYRLKACKELAKIYQEDGTWQAGWLLAYSFSDRKSCITHKERVSILKELEPLLHSYQEIQWLNSAQIQTLEHINYLKVRNADLKERVNQLELQLEESRNENQSLNGLIKELKEIEAIMNERISDEQP